MEFKKPVTKDFSRLIRTRLYGTNSRKIYEKFCDTLGWDKSKAGCFGPQTPLYAEKCDTKRENDVWFICYPNYDRNNINVSVAGKTNIIENNGNSITEIVDPKFGKSNNAKRITFVKTDDGYEFLGVFKLVKNGTTRVYEKDSDVYPIV